jgi:hypothetical protein
MSGKSAALLVGAAVVMACGGGGTGPNPGDMLDPSKPQYGKTYADWGAAWWTLVFETPGKVNPLLDPSGANCGQGQDPKSSVWFLFGTLGGAGDRTCTVPSGRALFFPLVNGEADNAGVPTAQLQTEAGLRTQAQTAYDAVLVSTLNVSLDGKPYANASLVAGGTPPTKFSYTLPPGTDNFYTSTGVPGVTGTWDPAFSDGYWVMLAPLAPGTHELKFGGTSAAQPQNLVVAMTYHLTVQ